MDSLELNKELETPSVEEVINAAENAIVEEVQSAENLTVTEQTEEAQMPSVTDEISLEDGAQNTEDTAFDSAEDDTEDVPPADENATDYSALSREELIEVLTELSKKEINVIKNDVENIKFNFYRKVKALNEEIKAKFVEAGNVIEDFIPTKDELEERFKTVFAEIRARKAEFTARVEKEKADNLLVKQHILEQMKKLIEQKDDVSSSINEFKILQQKWRETGAVPVAKSSELWREYSLNQEAFWDLVKINNELREYDFRKNLETKKLMCEAAERLAEEKDVISAFRKLQQLHEEWRELGPVAREMREEIWTRFKNASTIVNKRHQDYFEELRKKENDNSKAKEELCAKLEDFDFQNIKTFKEWDEIVKTVQTLQEEWRKIGFAAKKVNQKLYDRYRKACDKFFEAKTAFYKEVKTEYQQNIDKKTALCAEAEGLKDSTDWKKTSDRLIQLQKDWKQIGYVPRKTADELWKRFIAACDYFFEQKNVNTTDQRTEENANLSKKKEVLEKIKALNIENQQNALKTLRELIVEWNAIGFVPFKDKDKIYREYRKAVDKQFTVLNVDANNRKLDTFRSNLEDMATKGENKLYYERDKMFRAYEHLKQEIATYENNLGFFTSSSKKGGGLIEQMSKKVDTLKEEARLLHNKLKMLEEKIKN